MTLGNQLAFEKGWKYGILDFLITLSVYAAIVALNGVALGSFALALRLTHVFGFLPSFILTVLVMGYSLLMGSKFAFEVLLEWSYKPEPSPKFNSVKEQTEWERKSQLLTQWTVLEMRLRRALVSSHISESTFMSALKLIEYMIHQKIPDKNLPVDEDQSAQLVSTRSEQKTPVSEK